MIEIPAAEYIDDERSAQQLLSRIENLTEVAVDTETTGLRIGPEQDHVVFWSMADDNHRWTLHARVLPVFERFLCDPSRVLWLHNANFDTHMLRNSGIDITQDVPRRQHRRYDTMIGHALVDSDAPHDLKYAGPDVICGWERVPLFKMPSFQDVFGKGAKEAETARVLTEALQTPSGLEKAVNYASLDAWTTMRMARGIQGYLEDWPLPPAYGLLMHNDPNGKYTLWDYFRELEMPMMDVVYSMESEGIVLDEEYLDTLRGPVDEEIAEIEHEVQTLISQELGYTQVVNLRSSPQLQTVFFDKERGFGLDPPKMTDGGRSGKPKPSTDKNALEVLSTRGNDPPHILARLVSRHRKRTKLRDQYLNGLPRFVAPDGRIHTTFSQHVRTGRLASADPNMQNIPNREEIGRRIRGAFVPPPGHYLLCADYSQVEPRITAALSNDPGMVDSFLAGQDYHGRNAADMFNLDYDWIVAAKKSRPLPPECPYTEEELRTFRDRAKTLGLGLGYGEGPRKLAVDLECSFTEAKEMVRAFWKARQGMRQFFDERIEFAIENGWIYTLLGRKRDLNTINSPDKGSHAAAAREAQNTPIQGSASEIVKKAQIELYYDDELWDAGFRQVIQVHDEVLATVPDHVDTDWASWKMKTIMENPFTHPPLMTENGQVVPLIAEPGVAFSWMEAKG